MLQTTSYASIRRMQHKLELYNKHLEERISEQVKEITESQLATILALAKMAESRDDNTGQHLERVQFFSRLLAERLYEVGAYLENMSRNYPENIFFACSLHDICKSLLPCT